LAHLSAEPLVGLKHRTVRRCKQRSPFSRTPRGFEADCDGITLRNEVPFSRTPRGFEAACLPGDL